MSRPVLAAAGATFVVLIAIIFYLLGRDSAHRQVVVQPPPPQQQVAQTPPLPSPPVRQAAPANDPTPMFTLPPSSGAPLRIPADPPPSPPPSSSAPTTVAEAPPAPVEVREPAKPATNTAAIRTYFVQIAAIQTVSATGDSLGFANDLVGAAMSGDTSGFDRVLDSARAGADKARRITPPPECRAYHEKLLALLDDGIVLVGKVKQAIRSSDTGALAAIGASGSSLQSRAEALQAEEKAIRLRAGI